MQGDINNTTKMLMDIQKDVAATKAKVENIENKLNDAGGLEALSHQHVYSEELILEVVQAYLAGGTSYP
ncbi:hypothetical protein [Lactiplantibacillus paraplantarum]|uniref:hypothetical protein n=1 Tax=Lactiplantibacillus paraplantarum TaxID=60520 RepID=UPI0023AA2D5F|nr:hypothetical protein [Lactiplantibacillus paraplantarum]WEE35127.1 hypothetical protein PWO93_10535 [Lactiplantibacillus paraplantarum]